MVGQHHQSKVRPGSLEQPVACLSSSGGGAGLQLLWQMQGCPYPSTCPVLHRDSPSLIRQVLHCLSLLGRSMIVVSWCIAALEQLLAAEMSSAWNCTLLSTFVVKLYAWAEHSACTAMVDLRVQVCQAAPRSDQQPASDRHDSGMQDIQAVPAHCQPSVALACSTVQVPGPSAVQGRHADRQAVGRAQAYAWSQHAAGGQAVAAAGLPPLEPDRRQGPPVAGVP